MSDAGDDRDVEARIREALRSAETEDSRFEAPPRTVWEGIAAAIGDDTADEVAVERDDQLASGGWRSRSRWIVAAAAVVMLVATAVIALSWNRGTDSGVVSTAELSSDGLTGAPSGLTGSAEVVARSGHDTLRIDIDGLEPRSGEYLELWLITPDISGMVSLGTVRPDGTYAVPPGLWIDDYPVVDISTEPYDGNPSHSGSSLLRGTLTRT